MSRPSDEELQRYFDGELPERERRRIEAALPQDHAARAKLATLAEMRELYQEIAEQAADEAPLDGLYEAVRARIDARPAGPLERIAAWWHETSRPLVFAGAAAALAMVAGGVWLARGPAAVEARPGAADEVDVSETADATPLINEDGAAFGVVIAANE